MPDTPFLIEIRSGATRQLGKIRLTPLAQVVQFQPPGIHGGLVWNRPVAVKVQTGDGPEQLLAVRDVTRWVQILLLGLGVLGSLLIWVFMRNRTN